MSLFSVRGCYCDIYLIYSAFTDEEESYVPDFESQQEEEDIQESMLCSEPELLMAAEEEEEEEMCFDLFDDISESSFPQVAGNFILLYICIYCTTVQLLNSSH